MVQASASVEDSIGFPLLDDQSYLNHPKYYQYSPLVSLLARHYSTTQIRESLDIQQYTHFNSASVFWFHQPVFTTVEASRILLALCALN